MLLCGCETKDREAFSRQIEIRSVPSGARSQTAQPVSPRARR